MVEGLSHIFLHVGLCNSLAKLPAEATFPLRVTMAFRRGDPQFERTFTVTRGDGTDAVVEFDVGQGVYRIALDAGKKRCSANDFLDFLADGNRKVTEKLVDGPPHPADPVLLMDGTAPLSFLYVKPTFVLLDKSVTCDKPVGTPVASRVNVEYDQGSYHVWLYDTPPLVDPGPYTVALRLRTPASTAHYVRIPTDFPEPWSGFPGHIQMNVSEDMIDGLATEKVDTLLCPKLWQTTAH